MTIANIIRFLIYAIITKWQKFFGKKIFSEFFYSEKCFLKYSVLCGKFNIVVFNNINSCGSYPSSFENDFDVQDNAANHTQGLTFLDSNLPHWWAERDFNPNSAELPQPKRNGSRNHRGTGSNSYGVWTTCLLVRSSGIVFLQKRVNR